jgi:hypothetical protein
MRKLLKIPVIIAVIAGLWFAAGGIVTAISSLATATPGNDWITGTGIVNARDGSVNATIQIPLQDADLLGQFKSLGTITEVTAPNYSGIILMGPGYMSYAMSHAQQVFTSMQSAIANNNSFALVMYRGQQYRSFFYSTYLKALAANRMAPPIQLASSPGSNKTVSTLNPVLMNAPVVEITFNPFGVYIDSSSFDVLSPIAWMINTYLQEASLHAVHSRTGAAAPKSLMDDGFAFVGTVGWYTNYYIDLSGHQYLLGLLNVKSDYYYAEQSTAQGTYYFFLDYPTISAKGEITWFGANWLPINFHSFMGWETYKWPGQWLFSWGLLNAEFNGTLSYPGHSGPFISWKDISYPSGGNASTLETIWWASYGTTYTISPYSVGEVNPTKYGGALPMIMHSYYAVDNDITTLYASWDVYLYTNALSAYSVETGIN